MENQMSAEVVELLIETGKKLSESKTFDFAGNHFIVTGGAVEKVSETYTRCPETCEIYSLDGLVEFISKDVDGIFNDKKKRYIVHVCDPLNVRVLSPLRDDSNNRDCVVKSTYRGNCSFCNRYMSTEEFMVGLQTMFRDSDSLSLLKQVVGNMTDSQSLDCADDGVTQKLTIKKGVVTNGNVAFKNPIPLTPIRFFTEVEQVESPFVLRVRGGSDNQPVQVALFECDGGDWKIKAVHAIGEWLKKKLALMNVEVIA